MIRGVENQLKKGRKSLMNDDLLPELRNSILSSEKIMPIFQKQETLTQSVVRSISMMEVNGQIISKIDVSFRLNIIEILFLLKTYFQI